MPEAGGVHHAAAGASAGQWAAATAGGALPQRAAAAASAAALELLLAPAPWGGAACRHYAKPAKGKGALAAAQGGVQLCKKVSSALLARRFVAAPHP